MSVCHWILNEDHASQWKWRKRSLSSLLEAFYLAYAALRLHDIPGDGRGKWWTTCISEEQLLSSSTGF